MQLPGASTLTAWQRQQALRGGARKGMGRAQRRLDLPRRVVGATHVRAVDETLAENRPDRRPPIPHAAPCTGG
ncbi:MAG: hypothetical protein QOG98_1445 [Pseudonocardiales bacterium]|nr:hypothetical protein [Pseudonocardiales bacterium]